MNVHLADVLTFGAVCGAILAGVGVVVVLGRVVRFVFRLAKRAGQFLDQWFGDREAGVPSMPERLTQVVEMQAQQGRRLDEHLTWHSNAEHSNGTAAHRPVSRIKPGS